MPKDESFDITTGCDLQEVDNAVNQALKEISGRYDFKGVLAEIEYNRAQAKIEVHAGDQSHLDAIWDTLVGRFVSRKVPIENVQRGEVVPAGGDTVRQTLTLVQAIDSDTAKKISTFIRDKKLKNVKSQIQGDAVRVTGPSRDDLQNVIQALKSEDWGIELNFGNYRS